MGLKARKKAPAETRLVCTEGGSQKFWSCCTQGTQVTIRHGRLGTEGKEQRKVLASPELALAFARKSINAKVAKGYQAEGLQFARVPWSKMKSRVQVAGNSEEDHNIVLLYEGDLHVPHNLEMDYRRGLLRDLDDSPDQVVVGLLIEGNLSIDGCLVNYEDDFGPFLQVNGSLTATSVATGGSQIHITGDLLAEELVGVYNHGCVRIQGQLNSRVVATEHMIEADDGITALEYLGWHAHTFEVQHGEVLHDEPYDVRSVFLKSLIESESVNLGKARRALASGRTILQEHPTNVRDDFRKLVAKKLDEPEKVKRLSLSMKELRSLPEELFLFKNLEVLDLTHNQLRVLPDSIAQLTQLRELRVGGNGLQCLPKSIGALTQLRLLDLEANCITDLPDSLAQCSELREVCLTNNPYAYLSSSFGGWHNVRVMRELPEVLTRLPKLKRLEIDSTLIRRLPSRAFDSEVLEPVDCEDTLLLAVNRKMHPQFKPVAKQARSWAVGHIGFWFDDETIGLDLFYDSNRDSYDYTNVKAVLRLVLDALVPAAAPYKDALQTFQKECKSIVHSMKWCDEPRRHVQALFSALHDELSNIAKAKTAPAELVGGLQLLFTDYKEGRF